MDNDIFEYYNKIKNGEILVGKWILKLYKMLTSKIDSGDYIFDQKKADRVIGYIEALCRHCAGRSDLIKLELWQKAMLSAMFGIIDSDGHRLFREVVVLIGRKNGKTLLASCVMNYMAYADGEYSGEIYTIGPQLRQAKISFNNFYQMIKAEPELLQYAHKRRDDVYIERTNTTVSQIAFSEKRSDGFNPHLVINDEIASWEGERGLKQYEVMKSALGSRMQPMMLSISTAGYSNNGIYDELFKRATAVLNGSSNERRLLPFLYTIDDESKWNDMEELRKSNPNMGVSVNKAFFEEEIAVAENSTSKRMEFLTKYCNVKQNRSVAWLDYELVNSCGIDGVRIEDFHKSYAIAGIDLSQTTDLTAASVLIQKDGIIYCFTKFFMPRDRLEQMIVRDVVPYDIFLKRGNLVLSGDNYVDYRDITKWFLELQRKHKIYIMWSGYDRFSAQYLVNELNDCGFKTDDVRQGENLTPVISEFEGIIRDGIFKIVDNNLLKSHFLNVALKMNDDGRKFKPVKVSEKCRIDGFVSVIDAITVRQKYWAELKDYLENS
jgi:phage terminase large subunit-like protein